MRPWNNPEVLALGSRAYSIIQQENNYVVRHHPAHHIGAAAHRSDTKLALQHGVGLLSLQRNRDHSDHRPHPRADGTTLRRVPRDCAPTKKRRAGARGERGAADQDRQRPATRASGG